MPLPKNIPTTMRTADKTVHLPGSFLSKTAWKRTVIQTYWNWMATAALTDSMSIAK